MTTRAKIVLDGVDKTKAAFTSARTNVTGLEQTVAGAQRAFGLLLGAGAIGGVASAVTDAGLKVEQFERSLKVATGSSEGARRELDFVVESSKTLGLNLEETAGSYSKLAAASRGTALQGNDTRQIFLAISEASTVLGLSAEQTGGALTAIEQIISKGKVSAEELRGQLGERLPGAFQIAARSIGVTTAELDEMLRKGELTAQDLLPNLARELRSTFGPEVEDAANGAQAAINRFNTALFELRAGIADSGLLDGLTVLANKIAGIIAPTLEQELDSVFSKIAELRAELADPPRFAGPFFEANKLKELRDLEEQLDVLLLKQGELLSGAGPTPIERKSATSALEQFEKDFEIFDKLVAKQDAAAQRQLERQKEVAQTGLDNVIQSIASREQVEALAFVRRREMVENAISEELISIEHGDRLKRELELQLQKDLTDISNKGLSDRLKFQQLSNKEKAKDIFGNLAQITAGVANQNKALFRLNQVAAIANATINTAEGISKAWSFGPILGPIFAAVVGAAGAAQIAAIASTSFGSGTTPSLAGSTPTFDNQPVVPGDTGSTAQSANQPSQIIEVHFHGDVNGDVAMQDLLRSTIEELVNNDVVLISPSSRQAEEIRLGTGSGG